MIVTSPKGMILAATNGSKRETRGVNRPIHRSAWKGCSTKFASSIMDKSLPATSENASGPASSMVVATRCCGGGWIFAVVDTGSVPQCGETARNDLPASHAGLSLTRAVWPPPPVP